MAEMFRLPPPSPSRKSGLRFPANVKDFGAALIAALSAAPQCTTLHSAAPRVRRPSEATGANRLFLPFHGSNAGPILSRRYRAATWIFRRRMNVPGLKVLRRMECCSSNSVRFADPEVGVGRTWHQNGTKTRAAVSNRSERCGVGAAESMRLSFVLLGS